MYASPGEKSPTKARRNDMGIATSTLNLNQSKLHVAAPYLIEQTWADYTPEQHAIWAELVSRRMPQLREHACREYLDGFHQIGLREDKLPNLREVSALLQPRTGWQSTPVSGFLPADAFGHVPMHAHPVFANFLESYGKICAGLMARPDALERMGRLFWFTVEFGLIRQDGEIKVYGSGLISSHGECTRVLAGGCEVKDFDLDAVLNQQFQTSEMQPVLYAVESFDQIYEATKEAEKRLG